VEQCAKEKLRPCHYWVRRDVSDVSHPKKAGEIDKKYVNVSNIPKNII